MSLADIIDICRERNLPTEGKKSQLISDLLFWVILKKKNPFVYNHLLFFLKTKQNRKIIQCQYQHHPLHD